MDGHATRTAAEMLRSAWLEGRKLAELPEAIRPRELREGYAIQRELAGLIGETVGWKLAATSAATRAAMGLEEPVAGPLFAQFRCPMPARMSADGLSMGVAEAEFAFVLGRDLPVRAAAYEPEEVADAVSELRLAVEVPDSRFRDPGTVGAAQLAADAAFTGRFVLGRSIPQWRELDLASHAVSISKDGAVEATGSGENVLEGPLHALAWLANRSEHGGLIQGQIVLTGSCTVPVPIAAGSEIVADFGHLGSVGVRFSEDPPAG